MQPICILFVTPTLFFPQSPPSWGQVSLVQESGSFDITPNANG